MQNTKSVHQQTARLSFKPKPFELVITEVLSDGNFRVLFQSLKCEAVVNLSISHSFPLELTGGFVITTTENLDAHKPPKFPKLICYNASNASYVPKTFSKKKFDDAYSKLQKVSQEIIETRKANALVDITPISDDFDRITRVQC